MPSPSLSRRFLCSDSLLALLILAVAALFPIWSATPSYAAQTIVLGAIYAIALLGLDLIVGYAGALSIGHAALFGVGAYTVGALCVHQGMPGWLALPASALTGALMGWLMSLPLLKANDKYVALGTLVFGLSAAVIFNEWNGVTGGAIGLSLPSQQWFGLTMTTELYAYLALALLTLSLQAIKSLTNSAIGRAFEALRDAPIATDCMGINVVRHKQGAFITGGLFAGLAGGLFTLSQGYIAPSSFGFEMSVNFILALMLGGKKRRLGTLLGAAVVIYLPLLLASMIEWKPIIYGMLILGVNYFLPEGLAGLLPQKPRSVTPLIDKTQSGIHAVSRPSAGSLLELKNVTMRFGTFQALGNVTFHVEHGRIVGIIGPNGAGKSTLINILTGVYTPTEGQVLFNSQPLVSWSASQITQAGIARTFQNLQIFTGLTVFENILVGLHHAHEHNALRIALGCHKSKDNALHQRAWALLHTVGLSEHANRSASALSYGQKRFLEIARALACNPRLLLLDEPAAGMSGNDLMRLKTLILKIREQGITILLIEHHMDVLTTLSDHMLAFNFGALIAQGTPAIVTSHPAVKEAYLGS